MDDWHKVLMAAREESRVRSAAGSDSERGTEDGTGTDTADSEALSDASFVHEDASADSDASTRRNMHKMGRGTNIEEVKDAISDVTDTLSDAVEQVRSRQPCFLRLNLLS